MRPTRVLIGLCATLCLAACASPPPAPDGGDAAADGVAGDALEDATTPDAGSDAAPPRDAGSDVALLARCEELEPGGPIVLPPVASTLLGTVEPTMPRVMTPDDDPMMNPIYESAELAYRARGLDAYRRGPAQPRVRRADLGDATTPAGTRRSIAYFIHFADTQLVDDESPARLATLDTPGVPGAIRPQEAYLPRAMSAMNRTLGAVARPERPFQFGVVSGDCADSAQLNELRWFVQVMDGARGVHTDSGRDDDLVPGPGNDPKDPFDATAFPAPWYFVPGNHDVLVVGIGVPTPTARALAVGSSASNGTRDYARRWAPPRRGTVPADMDRRIIDRAEIVRELRASPARPGPVGHGYPEGADVSLGAHYTADVVPNLVRLLAFDTSDDTGGSNGLVRRATIDRWLRPELERAQRDGVLVFLASHHPATSIDRRMGEIGAPVADAVEAREIEQLLASFPNVVAWLVGHEHDVRVRAVRGADPARPGYWEVESGSIMDWPSQARAMEIVDNGNGTLSLFGTMIDFEPADCMERRFRRLTLMDYQSRWDNSDRVGTASDRNVELVVPIPPSAMARVAAATGSPRIESETTLRGMR